MKMEDAMDSDYLPLVISLKEDRDRRRGEGRKRKEHAGESGMSEIGKYLERC